MMIRLTRTRRLNTENGLFPLRTNAIEGKLLSAWPLQIGDTIRILGEALTPGMTGRLVATSPIRTVNTGKDDVIVETLNSVYKVERIKRIGRKRG